MDSWPFPYTYVVNSNPLLFAQLQLLFIQFLWLIGGKCFREYIRIISFVFHLAAAPQPTCRTLQRLALCSVSVFWSLAAPLASNRPPVTNLKPQHEVRIHRINQKLLSGNLGVNPKLNLPIAGGHCVFSPWSLANSSARRRRRIFWGGTEITSSGNSNQQWVIFSQGANYWNDIQYTIPSNYNFNDRFQKVINWGVNF